MRSDRNDDDATPSFLSVIPPKVRYDTRLPMGARVAFGEISALCKVEGYCWITNKKLGEWLGVKENAVRLWIAALKECGYIRVELDRVAKNVDRRKIWILPLAWEGLEPHQKEWGGPIKKDGTGPIKKKGTRPIKKKGTRPIKKDAHNDTSKNDSSRNETREREEAAAPPSLSASSTPFNPGEQAEAIAEGELLAGLDAVHREKRYGAPLKVPKKLRADLREACAMSESHEEVLGAYRFYLDSPQSEGFTYPLHIFLGQYSDFLARLREGRYWERFNAEADSAEPPAERPPEPPISEAERQEGALILSEARRRMP